MILFHLKAKILANYRLQIGNGKFLFLNEIKIDLLHYKNTKIRKFNFKYTKVM